MKRLFRQGGIRHATRLGDVTMDKRLITVSKYLAKYLRHAPQELGLTLQPGGWVPVDDLLTAAEQNGFPISYDELVDCVETNDKQRFAFDMSGELIRANQGHSVEVDLQLEEREPPEVLYHGTVERVPVVHLGSGSGQGASGTMSISQRTWRRHARSEPGGANRSSSKSMPGGCTGTVTSSCCRRTACG
jgi:hypothetical protein